MPVTFAPGRLRLLARPSLTGSLPVTKTTYLEPDSDWLRRNPITGIADCCPRVATGHAAAALG